MSTRRQREYFERVIKAREERMNASIETPVEEKPKKKRTTKKKVEE